MEVSLKNRQIFGIHKLVGEVEYCNGEPPKIYKMECHKKLFSRFTKISDFNTKHPLFQLNLQKQHKISSVIVQLEVWKM